MKLTQFRFYKNTPFTDFNNVLNKANNIERDNYMDNTYEYVDADEAFNFVYDRLELRVREGFLLMQSVNYCRFTAPDQNGYWYAQVVEPNYLNDGTTRIKLIVDPFMTFLQGNFASKIKNAKIERQTLSSDSINHHLLYLRTNDDVLPLANTKKIIKHDFKDLGKNMKVLMQISYDIKDTDFGDEDNPKMRASNGVVRDLMTSPVNLYLCDLSAVPTELKKIQNAPWVARCIIKTQIIPAHLIEISDLSDVDGFDSLKRVKGGKTKNPTDPWVSYTNEQISNIFGLTGAQLRSEYAEITVTNYQGQSFVVKPEYLPDDGFKLMVEFNSGYDNHIAFYPKRYRANASETGTTQRSGTYLDNALIFKDWDELPVMVDTGKMANASNANERKLAQNNLISGQAGNVLDKNTNLQDRLMSAINLTSSATVGAVTGKLTDEWQYYRSLQAQQADAQIQPNTITAQSTNNAPAIKQGNFGLTVKYAVISDDAKKTLRDYHTYYGYQCNWFGTPESVRSNSVRNYLKCSGGYYYIDDVATPFMEQIKVQLEAGVTLWH